MMLSKQSRPVILMGTLASVLSASSSPASELETVVISAGGASISRSLTQEQALAADGEHGDEYGWAVAVSADGSTVAVDAWRDDDVALNGGAVYILTRDGNQWVHQDKLLPDDGYTNAKFGIALDMSDSGDRVIIGDPNHTGVQGGAYIFDRDGTTWSQTDFLIPDEQNLVNQGQAVALSGDGTIAVIGGHYTPNGTARAFVFRFDETEWNYEQELVAGDGSGTDHFGHAVAISGDGSTIAVGEPRYDHYGPISEDGAVYIFRHDGNSWVEVAMVSPLNENGTFGGDISFSQNGTTMIVLTQDSPQGRPAWVYREVDGTWTFTEIWPPNGGSFFRAVDISGAGDVALLAYPTGNLVGAAYIYKFDGTDWNPSAFLEAEDGDGQDSFAVASIDTVALSRDGRVAVVGAPGFDEVPQIETGAVYIHPRLDGVFVAGQTVQGSLSSGMLALEAGIVPTWPAPTPELVNPADTNGDGEVDILDLLDVLGSWGDCPDCPADVNDDGVVDILDLLAILAGWGG